MTTVLFIDDDGFMLRALRRLAQRLRPDWIYITTEDAANWQQALDPNNPPDLVVCDYLMPIINGDKVLVEVMNTYPTAIRAMLTGDTTVEVIKGLGDEAHFILAKPFNDEDFKRLFICVERLKEMKLDETMRVMLSDVSLLLPLPQSVKRVRFALKNESVSAEALAETVSSEPIVVAKVLQLANSAFMGFSRTTWSLEEAIKRLGTDLLLVLLTSIGVASYSEEFVEVKQHKAITEKALKTALLSKELSSAAMLPNEQAELAFSTALLSSIGHLVVAHPSWQHRFGGPFNHINEDSLANTINVYILTLWGYPEDVCHTMSLLYQDYQENSQEYPSALIVRAAQMSIENHNRIPEEWVLSLPSSPIQKTLLTLVNKPVAP